MDNTTDTPSIHSNQPTRPAILPIADPPDEHSLKRIHPVKWGLAFTAVGHYISGSSGISSVNGVKTSFVTVCVFLGFFMGALGIFICTLYTNGHGKKKVDETDHQDNSRPL